MITQINLSQEKEKKLQALAETAEIEAADLITIFVEDLLDRQEDLQKWFDRSFRDREDSCHEILENLYDSWMQRHSRVDHVCDQLESLSAQSYEGPAEAKMIEILAEFQETSFWEGARMVRRMQEILRNL